MRHRLEKKYVYNLQVKTYRNIKLCYQMRRSVHLQSSMSTTEIVKFLSIIFFSCHLVQSVISLEFFNVF